MSTGSVIGGITAPLDTTLLHRMVVEASPLYPLNTVTDLAFGATTEIEGITFDGTTATITKEGLYEVTAGVDGSEGAGVYVTGYIDVVDAINGNKTYYFKPEGTDGGLRGTSKTFKRRFSVGATIKVQGETSFGANNRPTHFSITELPSSEVVVPSLVPVETLHKVRMRRVAPQSMIAGFGTTIQFDTAEYNVGGIGNTATGEVTIARAGYYRIAAGWANTINQNGVQIVIDVDGTPVFKGGEVNASGGGISLPETSGTLFLNVGQVVVARGFVDIATQNTDTQFESQPFFEVIEEPQRSILNPDAVSHNVQTGANYTAIEIGAYRDLTFEVASIGDGAQALTFPLAFSAPPKQWDISITMRKDNGTNVAPVNIDNGTLTAVSVQVDRDNTFADASNPFFIVRVRGLI